MLRLPSINSTTISNTLFDSCVQIMTINTCFAPSIRVNLQTSTSQTPKFRLTVCTLAPERSSESNSRDAKKASKPTHRILPDNVTDSERPPPTPRHHSVPAIGYYLEKWLGIGTSRAEMRERYGPIYSSNYYIDERTYISDYDAMVEAFRDPEVFRTKGSFEAFETMFGEDNITVNDFEVHTKGRNRIMPAFAPALFPQYMGYISKRARKTWERVHERSSAGEQIKLEPVFRENYVAIVVEMTTGIDMDGENAARIRQLFQKFLVSIFSPKFGPVRNAGIKSRDTLMGIIAEVVRKNLRERRDEINKLRGYGDRIMRMGVKEVAVGNVDILLVLMAESSLSTEPGAAIDEEVVESLCYIILLLWFAGYSTSAATSTCMSFEMGLDDSIFRRLVAEQDPIVAAADGVKNVTYQQLMNEMPLLDSYILEILRARPPVGVLGRKVSKDIEMLGYYVPKDTLVFLDLVAVHLDSKLYPDPHKIVVDRFVKKEGKPKPPGILSFGAPGSPHYCIGAALAKVMMKTTMGTLLREYSYVLDKQQTKEYQSVPDISPKSGVVLESFTKRDH